MKKIILYNLSEQRKNAIKNILSEDISISFIDKSNINEIVGDIFDDKQKNTLPDDNLSDIFDNEFMLIQGFDSEEDLRDLLFSFKSNLLARPITSARTENNEKWILKNLLQEIFEENEYMKNMNR
ncbi:MAG: DUF3783 domain-containing protein [Peptostreptococcaceae bacterium]|jgi:hypothetical protein|nr:DUF3783 domain-containing protein [Peptostreptococcaceae bacterium]